MVKLTRKEVQEKVENDESLEGADLSGLDLRGVNLYGVNLQGANLRGADLRLNDQTGKEVFQIALDMLYTPSMQNVAPIVRVVTPSLRQANLQNADLQDADLRKVDLQGGNLTNAELQRANLGGADLQGTIFQEATLRAANLRESNLQGANLQKADLSSATVENADLSGADISGANIYHLNTHGWKIEGIKCTHIYQCECFLSKSEASIDTYWRNSAEKDKYQQNFAPAEFEMLYGSKTFDVAISFAGSERKLAEELATRVREAGFCVFYDDFYPEMLWGRDLTVLFERIYCKTSRFCVIFCSIEYKNRMWTTYERKCAITRQLEEKDNEYILLIKVDDTKLPGIPSIIGDMAIDKYGVNGIVETLIRKLRSPTKQQGM